MIEKMGLGDMVDGVIIHDAARPFVMRETTLFLRAKEYYR